MVGDDDGGGGGDGECGVSLQRRRQREIDNVTTQLYGTSSFLSFAVARLLLLR